MGVQDSARDVFWRGVQGLGSLYAPQTVRIRDWRLDALIATLRFGILIYIFVRALFFWTVISYEDIGGNYNSWTFEGWTTPEFDAATTKLCNGDSTYDFRPKNPMDTGGVYARNHSCPTYMGRQIFKTVGDEAQFTVWDQKVRTDNAVTGCGWDPKVGTPKSYHEKQSPIDGEPCIQSHYVYGVEDVPLFVIHTASAPDSGFQVNNLPCNIVADKESGTIEGARGTHEKLDLGVMDYGPTNGNGWMTNLRQLLQYAGADNARTLEDWNEGNNMEMEPGSKVRLRFTGFILNLRFKYWNYASLPSPEWGWRSFPFDWSPSQARCELRVELQKQAWGYTGAMTEPGGTVSRHVARIKMTGEGQFGTVSLILIISVFVEAVVLLSAASAVGVFLAKHCFYGRNYRELVEIVYDTIVDHDEDQNEAASEAASPTGGTNSAKTGWLKKAATATRATKFVKAGAAGNKAEDTITIPSPVNQTSVKDFHETDGEANDRGLRIDVSDSSKKNRHGTNEGNYSKEEDVASKEGNEIEGMIEVAPAGGSKDAFRPVQLRPERSV